MFERLLQFDRHTGNQGMIWSLEGDHYIAFAMTPEGEIVKQAEKAFKSLVLAKEWLQKEGVNRVSLRQSHAYSEMIGQAPEVRH